MPLHDAADGPLDADWAEASETDRAIVGALAGMLTASTPARPWTRTR